VKTILLLRHAKSDWAEPGLADFDRPLNKRGFKDAPVMGEALALFNVTPNKILSSPAQRAKQTAELVAAACGYVPKLIQWEGAFYGGGSHDLIAALRRLPDEVERVLLVGHNPVIEQTAAILWSTGGDEAEGLIRFPTGGLACFEADITKWAELRLKPVVLRWFLIPKLAQALRQV
jgi:phosphohistidine phosphatase